MTKLHQAAETAVRKCLNLREDESCIVVTDDVCTSIGEVLFEVAEDIAEDVAIIRYSSGEQFSEEPPTAVSVSMKEADVVFAPTANSLSHTQARSSANDAGARIATLPTITEDVFLRGLTADYNDISNECERIHSKVSDANIVKIVTEKGTNITFESKSRSWFKDTGIIRNPGEMTNLPAGEVFTSPQTANGTFVVDGTMRPHGLLADDHEIRIKVEDGYVTEIDDKGLREEVESAAGSVGNAAYNIAEIGIGTNTGVKELIGSVLLDEKAAGTVHIAIGDDHAIGGDTEAPIHLDGIIRNPKVYVDGEEIELPSGI